MRKALFVLLICLLALVSCQKIPPAPFEHNSPPQDRPQPVKVTKVTLVAASRYIDLTSNETAHITSKDAEVFFYCDGPIDLGSVPRGINATNHELPSVSFRVEQGTEAITLPRGLKDTNGNVIESDTYALEWKYFGIASAKLLNYPEIDVLNWYGTVLSPGEIIRVEFEGQGYKEYIKQIFARYLKDNHDGPIPYTIEWVAPNVMHFSINSLATKWAFVVDEEDLSRLYWDLYLVPPQRLIASDKEGKITQAIDIPLSSIGAVSMTDDYKSVRLVRLGKINKLTYGANVHQFDLTTQKITLENEQAYHWSWPEYQSRADWYHKSVRESEMRKLGSGFAVGFSNDGTRLAYYKEHPDKGLMLVLDIKSNSIKEYGLTTHTFEEVINCWFPHPILWSPDQSRLFYYAHEDGLTINGGRDAGIYSLDLTTGKETLALAEHRLFDASPYSEHLFTRYEADYYISNYAGEFTKLNAYKEGVQVVKWIDGDRVLVNKWFDDYRRDSKTYIYHIAESRFDFMGHGAAFDYDEKTGNIYILQRR